MRVLVDAGPVEVVCAAAELYVRLLAGRVTHNTWNDQLVFGAIDRSVRGMLISPNGTQT